MHKAKRPIGVMSFVLLAVFGTSLQAMAQGTQKTDGVAPYPKMAPVDQYLMTNRDEEIALARSAAPASISHDATVLVLDARDAKQRSKVRMASSAWWVGVGQDRSTGRTSESGK